jgi:hypothetical protein
MSEVDPSIKFITVLPKVKFKCHYILNDGEEHWMDYDELLKFCQSLSKECSVQLMELFVTHESFILDVEKKSIEVLTADPTVYEQQRMAIMLDARNPGKAYSEYVKQKEAKIPFENRIIQKNSFIIDQLYKKGRDQ